MFSDSKEPACSVGDLGSILGLGRSLGEGNGNPFWYSCMENPWTAESGGLYHRVGKSRTWLSDWHFHFTFKCVLDTYAKTCLPFSHVSLTQPYEVDTMITPILEIKKQKSRRCGRHFEHSPCRPSTDRTCTFSLRWTHSCPGRQPFPDSLAAGSALVTGLHGKFGQIGCERKWCMSLGLWLKTWQWPSFNEADEDNMFREQHSIKLGTGILEDLVQHSTSGRL